MKTFRPIFGLKWGRFTEWTRDIRAEKPGFGEFYHMTVLAIKAVLHPISRKAYIRRLTICHRCPVFNRKLKSCRNGEQGCGCYTPYKALGPVDCWSRERDLELRKKLRAIGADPRINTWRGQGWGRSDPR